MSDGVALLATVYANPKDDTARLVYADWLEENDDPDRAEFIRVQCKLAAMSDATIQSLFGSDTKEKRIIVQKHAALRLREYQLLQKHIDDWTPANLPRCWQCSGTGEVWDTNLDQVPCLTCDGGKSRDFTPGFTRGFVSHLTARNYTTVVLFLMRRAKLNLPTLEREKIMDRVPWVSYADSKIAEFGWWEEGEHLVTLDEEEERSNIHPDIFRVMWDRNPANRSPRNVHDDPNRWILWDDPADAIEELEIATAEVLK